jgi:hypothetical protein
VGDDGELARGREAAGRLAWADAYTVLSLAGRSSSLAGEDLELLATAAYLLGRVEDCLRALQRAQRLHAEAGELRRAARCAFWLAFHLINQGEPAQASGWLARANRLLEDEQECAERGFVLVPVALGQVVAGDARLAPPSPASMLRLASSVGEKETLARYPDLVDPLVAALRDPVTDRAAMAEFHALISPFALVSPSGWRRRSRVRPDELRHLPTPTLLIWGEQDPVGSIPVARAITELIPDARLEVLPTGHGPWLGQPTRTAEAVADFVCR